MGNFYADDYLRGSLGVATRFGSSILLADAASETLGGNISDPLGVDNDGDVKFTDTKILIGSALYLTSTIYSFVSSKNSVEEFNAQFDIGTNIEMPRNSGGGQRTPVPVLSMRFRF